MGLKKIYSKSLEVAFKHKALWVIGIVVAVFSGGGFSFQQNLNLRDTGNLKTAFDSAKFEQLFEYFRNIISSIPIFIWLIFFLSLFLSLVIGFIFTLVVRNWALGSLIGGISEALEEKIVTLKTSSEHGIKSLKNLLWLNIIPWLLYLLILLPLIIFVIILLNLLLPLGFILAVILALLALIGLLAIAAIQIWATRVAVLEGKSGEESFFEGWQLVKDHLFKMVVLGCSNTCISCLSGCVLSCFVITIIVPLGLSGAFFYSLSHENPIITFGLLAIGLIFIIPLLLGIILFRGIYTVFNYSTWNILYREIHQENSQEEQQ